MMLKRILAIVAVPLAVLLLGTVLLVVVGAAPQKPGQTPATTFYVDDDTCPAAGSGTQLDPFCRIQTAVDAADEGDEIRVATGVYTGAETVAADPWGGTQFTYTQVVFIGQGLTVLGGYEPPDWDTSNPTRNPTVIDAEGYGRCITILQTGQESVTVEGFTITGGDYSGLGNRSNASNTVCQGDAGTDCGGGLYGRGSIVVLRNSVVTANVAGPGGESAGGGIYLWRFPGAHIDASTVAGNSAPCPDGGGGGMYTFENGGPMSVTGCTFRDNHATARGGGMQMYDVEAPVIIQDVEFLNNTAAGAEGGGAHIRLSADGDILHADRVRFIGNQAHLRASALYMHAAGLGTPRARLTNLLFGGNGVTATAASDAVIGINGAFANLDVSLAHVTAAYNKAPTFLFARPPSSPEDRLTVTLTNTLVVSFTNAFAGREGSSGEALIRHVNTLVQDVTTLHYALEGSPTFEPISPLKGDPKLDSTYHLQLGSAAIDAGVDAGVGADVDGHYRPQGIAPDVGADEYVFDQAPDTVWISGPTTVAALTDALFVASVRPVTATLPITYVWQTGGQPPVMHENLGLVDTVELSWSSVGMKTITVTATSARGTARDTFQVDVTGEPLLSIDKSGPAEALAGEPITYTLAVTNSGVEVAVGVVITDRLPVGATYVTGGGLVDDVVLWTIPTLAANGGVAERTFVVTASSTISNADYRVTAAGGYSAAGSEPVVTAVGVPSLTITKSAPFAVGPGESIDLKLTVANHGPVTARDLVITDVLPAGATYISGGTLEDGEVRWNVDSLPGNGGLTSVSCVVAADQTIVNEDYGVIAAGGFGATGDSPVATLVGSGTRYVAPGGLDVLNNCTDSGVPCTTLQHAVDAALEGEEVRVAEGTYTGTATVSYAPLGTDCYTYTQVAFIGKGLTLRGGYAVGEWGISAPEAHATVIDAAGNGRGVSVVSAGGPVTVDGFTITGGNYTGLGNPPGVGNTVCADDPGSDCGGGVYAFRSALVLRSSVITGNVAGDDEFSVGGGIYLWQAKEGTRIEQTTVAGNSVDGPHSSGGGLCAAETGSPIVITGSGFRDNYAAAHGGGMYLDPAEAQVTIEDTQITNNRAGNGTGGGAYMRLGESGEMVHMDRVWMGSNRSADGAAALFIAASGAGPARRARLTNLVLHDNSTDAARDSDAAIGIGGGGASLDVSLVHVTAAHSGAPTFLYAKPPVSAPGFTVTVSLTNTLLVSVPNAFVAEEGAFGDVLIRHVRTLTDDVTTLHKTLGGLPAFEAIDAMSGDTRLGEDYRLQSGSAAIDAGVDAGVAIDIDGQARPYGRRVDIGADEFVPVAPESVSIVGPTTGYIGGSHVFEAVVSPPTASGPFTYTWSPEPDRGQGAARAEYRWTTGGTKSIGVTAANALGTTPPAAYEIELEAYKVFLPLVVRN